jgi:defect-in-organelle-trafficking protein DotA
MNKILTFIFLLFPSIVLAAEGSSLSFAPPPSDYSVVFLGNLFGVVDGVLHGTGSQMLGTMFGVFNSAVLALGGIVIMYTLIVSTMNTAHEGQVLGQKFSSIWVPIRSTAGLALLIPKASGYCLMQVFVMWIVVQGVGAADKLWNTALDYMNKGGVIIQAEISNPLGPQDTPMTVANGAADILSGQVCMLGLQQILEDQRSQYMQMKDQNTGPCISPVSDNMETICNNVVPDFLSTVNAVDVQANAVEAAKSATAVKSFTMPMPNFDDDAPYSYLNGICGQVTWNAFDSDTMKQMKDVSGTNNLETIELSRAIGIQAMYSTLQNVARVMINNDPSFKQSSSSGEASTYSDVAEQQYGVPYTASQNVCKSNKDNCVAWGKAPSSKSPPLFNGTQFLGAVQDYNAVLQPAMNLQNQSDNLDNAKSERAFINTAELQGWIMAGTYFFDLVQLNGSSAPSDKNFDTTSGLNNSAFSTSTITSAFGTNNDCQGNYADLCYWLDKNPSRTQDLVALINGSGSKNTALNLSQVFSNTVGATVNTVTDERSSTVYGYITNSMTIQTPGQPGLYPDTQFASTINLSIDTEPYTMSPMKFSCGRMAFIGCLGALMGDVFYNIIFLTIYNTFMLMFQSLIEQTMYSFLIIPISGMLTVFAQGTQALLVPGVNPVVALARMGVTYINFSADLWIMELFMAISALMIPVFGLFVLALFAMALPLIIAWTSVMVAIGFSTAYYVPLLPYMMFTFGAFSWLMAVVEAMVAGPIVALGITHPEGHEAFGKGEQAVMILVNLFLRPSMMIIGYIAGIALTYVGVWLLNAGFGHATAFMAGDAGTVTMGQGTYGVGTGVSEGYGATSSTLSGNTGDTTLWTSPPPNSPISIDYTGWAGIYAYFFTILIYTSTYLVLVQNSFKLIVTLPDKVTRWVSGGQGESYGGESAEWGKEVSGKVDKGGEKSDAAGGGVSKKAGSGVASGINSAADSVGSSVGGDGDATVSAENSVEGEALEAGEVAACL